MLQWGAYFMVLAVVLVYVDNPTKGVPWDKVGAAFALLGGFGIGGAAGGWIGQAFASTANTVLTKGGEFLARALGATVTGAIFLGLMLWVASRIKKGLDSKSKSKLRLKALFALTILAIVGAILTLIPSLYAGVDSVAVSLGTALRSAFS
jgi:hypothetical protein